MAIETKGMGMSIIYNEDCFETFKRIGDKSIGLILTDPPYNINKAEWDKIPNYIDWCGKWLSECQRILKDNGSFYFFHNDMPQIARLMNWIEDNTSFVFKQFIVWNKRFEGSPLKGYMDGYVCVDNLRNYKQMAEYCLFYTFQDETGSNQAAQDVIRSYLRSELNKYGIANDINKLFWRNGWANNGSNIASHFFGANNQNCLPTFENYRRLQTTGYFQKPYETLHREYESSRLKYESLRYTFNNQKTHHSVWNYEIAERNGGHITPKPVPLIENIIKHSSNEGDLIFDPFMGSGTTAIACLNTNRNYIGCELDKTYYDICIKRIEEHRASIESRLL